MADRAGAKSRAQSRKKGAMKGLTVKGGHKLSVKQGAGLTEKGVTPSIKRQAVTSRLLSLKVDHVRNHSVLAHVDGLANVVKQLVVGGSANG